METSLEPKLTCKEAFVAKKQRKRNLITRFRSKCKKEKLNAKKENRYSINNIETLYFTPCIYFLKCKGNIVYIGETESVMTRVGQHLQENTKIFDSFTFEVFEGSRMQRKRAEANLINKFQPFYNKAHIKEKKVRIYGLT
jgi:NADPH:quinone reductase-like Zn-dependent oxidoreductase